MNWFRKLFGFASSAAPAAPAPLVVDTASVDELVAESRRLAAEQAEIKARRRALADAIEAKTKEA